MRELGVEIPLEIDDRRGSSRETESKFSDKIEGQRFMNHRPRNPTPRDRQVAEEAISHEEANFPETPTGRKLVRQAQMIGGFFLLIVAVLFGLMVASFPTGDEPSTNSDTPNQITP